MLHYVSVITNLHELFPDLICALVSVSPLIQNATSKRRKIVGTNELIDHTSVTFWGDFAENDGAFLKKLKDDKSILGLCDVRVSIYKGIQQSINLYCSCEQRLNQSNVRKSKQYSSLADKKDITVTPSKVMLRIIEVPLVHILDGLLADSHVRTNRHSTPL
ncbi:hypothetical protein H5410_026277 [Solanum commersonii]|uniref:Uncharacterized protein n=1 Tax=Solanum commersonii TaxID=4109 RepID=A0A9J5YW37_SOLCO|nr:hypothetical protein H5410_026277 [Solanum commersonii]